MKEILFLLFIITVGFGLSNTSAQSEIFIETDYDSFEQGQAIVITGNAETEGVSIQVIDPNGASILVRSITTDSDGNFGLEFKVPQNGVLGDYKIMASIILNDLPVISSTTFTVVEKSDRTDQVEEITKEKQKGGCLIATATFGSEMSSQVQFLREIRDNTVLQTESGSAFLTGFNQFYYSFSPAIADYERENPTFKEVVKLALTPLLTSLTLLQYADIDSESEMLGYGIGVILLNIGMYFVTPAVLIMMIKNRWN